MSWPILYPKAFSGICISQMVCRRLLWLMLVHQVSNTNIIVLHLLWRQIVHLHNFVTNCIFLLLLYWLTILWNSRFINHTLFSNLIFLFSLVQTLQTMLLYVEFVLLVYWDLIQLTNWTHLCHPNILNTYILSVHYFWFADLSQDQHLTWCSHPHVVPQVLYLQSCEAS